MTRTKYLQLVFVIALGLAALSACCKRSTPPVGMVGIPGGKFTMGCVAGDQLCLADEKPAHHVKLDAFWMDEHPVTVTEYGRCVTAGACKPPKPSDDPIWGKYDNWGKPDRANHPMNSQDWEDADRYCRWAEKRLPTEAEFERALRGGREGAVYPWGADKTPPAATAPSQAGAPFPGADAKWVGAWPVCLTGRNAYGLCDMGVNVWEWCADWYGADYYASSPSHNPTGPHSGPSHVLRGGSRYAFPQTLRASYREFGELEDTAFYTGFRCVKNK
jgi:formylglycine-generating enzyme required for sulfatase activity